MDTPAALPATPPRLQLAGIGKAYPGVVANHDISLSVGAGEIHALLGENGAGKSTLMKIVYGLVRPDQGTMLWDGQPVRIDHPSQARRLGIAMVFQHFSLFETLTVAENIALTMQPPPPTAQLAMRIRQVSAQYGLPIDPARLVHSMSVGERQRVEIVRCLLQQPRLLIMDEPTSVLAPAAVQTLFATLRQLAAEGCSILYISHKLEEIRALCQHATVLRGGRVAGSTRPAEETGDSLARMMLGAAPAVCTLALQATGAPRLVLRHLSLASEHPFGVALKDISLTVAGGEIVGIAGVSGNGQRELLAALSGERRAAHGVRLSPAPDPAGAVIEIMGQPADRLDPARRRHLGLTLVPEERLGRGAVPAMSLAQNALLTGAGHGMVRRGWLRHGAIKRYACDVIARFAVQCGGEHAIAASLSGGNLQKFIVGREAMLQPKLMIVAQPTWGVDVGAAQQIHQALIDLRNAGVALLVISEELDELLVLCDRICVLSEGRLSPAVQVADASPEQMGQWLSGGFAAGAASRAQVLHADA